MITTVFLCRRRPDVTHQEYVERLLGGHVPIALAHHPTMRAYAVNVVDGARNDAPPLDSIGVLGFDSLEDFRERLYDSAEGERIVVEDVARFLGGADGWATTARVWRAPSVHPRLGVASPGGKLFVCLRRRAGMSRAAFAAHWEESHVPLALSHHPGLVRYVTSVVEEPLAEGLPEWDGFAELSFDAVSALDAPFDSATGERRIREDVERFIGEIAAYAVTEYVQKER